MTPSLQTPLRGKRIIIVFGAFELGGAERQAILLARYLKDTQCAAVEVWAYSAPEGRAAQLCDEFGVPWRVIPNPWVAGRMRRVAFLFNLARALRRARVEIILPYMITQNVACALVRRLCGAKLCVWNQRDDGGERVLGRKGQMLETLAVRRTALFIANSPAGAEFLVRDLDAPAERVHIVHNGIHLAPPLISRPNWRARLAIREDQFMACMLANLSRYKDHETVVRAWRLVVNEERHAKAILVLAGRLDDRAAAITDLMCELRLQENMRMSGAVADVSGLLQAADLGVFSSLSEGCPNGVLECMASGLAVAATDIPGVRDAVGESGARFLAPPRDVETLAARMLVLMDDAELRRATGEANKKRIEEEFDIEHMGQRTTALIAQALQESTP